MNREFTIGIFAKILYSLLAIGLIIFSLYLFNIPLSPDRNKSILIMPLVILISGILLFIKIFRNKIIVTDNKITRVGLFITNSLDFAQIRGCRFGQKTIYIESISVDDGKITLNNYSDYEGSEELANYLKETFPDIDSIDLKKNQEFVLDDISLGSTETDRKEAIKRAKITAIAYNIIGSIASFIALFMENPHVSSSILIGVPILAIIVMTTNRRLIKLLTNRKISVNATIIGGFIPPAMFLLIKSLNDYDVLKPNTVWLSSILIVAAVFVPLYYLGINKSIGGIKAQVIIMLFISTVYGFGSVRLINCAFDNANSKNYQTLIVNKWIHSGKGRDYYLTLKPWENGLPNKDVIVSRVDYDLHRRFLLT
jgi:hypothetical protein